MISRQCPSEWLGLQKRSRSDNSRITFFSKLIEQLCSRRALDGARVQVVMFSDTAVQKSCRRPRRTATRYLIMCCSVIATSPGLYFPL